MLTKDSINEALADAVMNRPREFFIGNRRFCLWSPSLGQSMLIQRHLSELKIEDAIVKANPSLEALRLANKSRDEVCRLIATYTFNRYSDFCYSKRIEKRSKFFVDNLSDEELAQLLMLIFSEPRIEDFLKLAGIADEQQKQSKISKVKNENGHTITFGGRTIYGTLIGPACEKFHLTPFQAIWEISLINLQMLVSDAVNTVYLSDEEFKKCKIVDNKNLIDADNPANMAAILAQDWS